MKLLIPLAAFLLVGCASQRHAEDISKKREEIKVLREEIAIAIVNLDHLERELAVQGDYPTRAQLRDLDYFISVIRHARDKVAAEDRRMHQQYGGSYGPL